MKEETLIIFAFILMIFLFGVLFGSYYGKYKVLKEQRQQNEVLLNTRFVVSIPMEKGEAQKHLQMIKDLLDVTESEETDK